MPNLINETNYQRIRNKPQIQKHNVENDKEWEEFQLEDFTDEEMIKQLLYHFPSQTLAVTGSPNSNSISKENTGVWLILVGSDDKGPYFLYLPDVYNLNALKFYIHTKEIHVIKFIPEFSSIHTYHGIQLTSQSFILFGTSITGIKWICINNINHLTDNDYIEVETSLVMAGVKQTTGYNNSAYGVALLSTNHVVLVKIDCDTGLLTIYNNTTDYVKWIFIQPVLDKIHKYFYPYNDPYATGGTRAFYMNFIRFNLISETFEVSTTSVWGEMAYNENCPLICYLGYLTSGISGAVAANTRLFTLSRTAASVNDVKAYEAPAIINANLLPGLVEERIINGILVEKDNKWYAIFFNIKLDKIVVAHDITNNTIPSNGMKIDVIKTGFDLSLPNDARRSYNHVIDLVDGTILYTFRNDYCYISDCSDPLNIKFTIIGFPLHQEFLTALHSAGYPNVIKYENYLFAIQNHTTLDSESYNDFRLVDLNTMKPVNLEAEGWHAYLDD
jgi:hypothetical protein